MNLREELLKIAKLAQGASRKMANIPVDVKNAALNHMAEELLKSKDSIMNANKKDVTKAKAAKMSASLVDRLTLNEKRIRDMADSLKAIAGLDDPVGLELRSWRIDNGLDIHKVRVPIGVIVIIYESRPDVTADCIGLCFKSGNSVILRGGSESLHSNRAIYKALKAVLDRHNITEGAVSLITTPDRRAIDELLKLNAYIDLVMPRGGEGLINKVVKASRIPVIKHYKGICHVYVDDWADLNMAHKICFNAKVQRPGVCNAMECMLVHKDTAARFLPGMLKELSDAGVEIRGCAMTRKIARNIKVKPATDKDYRTEYLDLILSVKVVASLDDAIDHVNNYGSHHSDSIVTENHNHALKFLKLVDSACVYANASTRFTDGGQFGMGAEIGISTDKLHARGPMALEELTTYKYMVFGSGQVRT
jgi:glutamate-5-semialdehyde dehydrogenase